jgi:membrane fusion protein, heavy metal efflux system
MKARWKIVAAVVLGVTAGGCHRALSATPEAHPPENQVWLAPEQAGALRVEVIRTQNVQDSLRLGGRVTFDDLRIGHVFSPVTGRVLRLLAAPGDRVKKGAPLAILASPDVGSTWSDVVKARADLDSSQREYQRQKELYEAHAGPLKDLEAAEGAFRKARAELQRAESKARLLQTEGQGGTQEYVLRAPIDGEVVARNANPGVEVQGQYGGGTAVELFTIGEQDQVLVIADLHEQDLSQVHAGMETQVRVVSALDRAFTGKVDWVSSALDATTHTAKVRIRVDNAERLLKPEMFATVVIALVLPPTVALPRGAVLHLGEQAVVFVALGELPDGRLRFERRRVQVREDVSGDLYPVLAGLRDGETVVVDGALLLSGVS